MNEFEQYTTREFLEYMVSDEYKYNRVGDAVTEQELGGNLQDKAWADRDFLDLKKRANEIEFVRFNKMPTKDTFTFNVDAVTTNTAFHTARIQSQELPELLTDFEGNDEEKEDVKEAIQTAIVSGEVLVWCSDPSMKWWGLAFVANTMDSFWHTGPEPEYSNIYPSERNPDLRRAGLCKHLFRILTDIEDGKHLDEMAEPVMRKIRTGRY